MECSTSSHSLSFSPSVAPLQQYHSLCQAYTSELTLWGTGVARQLLLSPQAMVTSLLHMMDGCHDNARLSVRAQLHLLSCSEGHATLVGIRDYLAVPSFKSGIHTLLVLEQDMYMYFTNSCGAASNWSLEFRQGLEVYIWY